MRSSFFRIFPEFSRKISAYFFISADCITPPPSLVADTELRGFRKFELGVGYSTPILRCANALPSVDVPVSLLTPHCSYHPCHRHAGTVLSFPVHEMAFNRCTVEELVNTIEQDDRSYDRLQKGITYLPPSPRIKPP